MGGRVLIFSERRMRNAAAFMASLRAPPHSIQNFAPSGFILSQRLHRMLHLSFLFSGQEPATYGFNRLVNPTCSK